MDPGWYGAGQTPALDASPSSGHSTWQGEDAPVSYWSSAPSARDEAEPLTRQPSRRETSDTSRYRFRGDEVARDAEPESIRYWVDPADPSAGLIDGDPGQYHFREDARFDGDDQINAYPSGYHFRPLRDSERVSSKANGAGADERGIPHAAPVKPWLPDPGGSLYDSWRPERR